MSNHPALRTIATGSPELDLALGIGGVPRGRLVELQGPQPQHAAILALSMIAAAQRQGLICAYIDGRHEVSVRVAQRLGVNLERLLIAQPDTPEQALEIATTLAKTGSVDLIVVDRIPGDVVPEHHIGLQSRIVSQHVRTIAGAAYVTGAAVVFVTDSSEPIDRAWRSSNSLRNATKYFASIRVQVIPAEPRTLAIKVSKNKHAPPFTEASVVLAPQEQSA